MKCRHVAWVYRLKVNLLEVLNYSVDEQTAVSTETVQDFK